MDSTVAVGCQLSLNVHYLKGIFFFFPLPPLTFFSLCIWFSSESESLWHALKKGFFF